MTGNIPDYECGPHLMCNAKNKKTPVCTKSMKNIFSFLDKSFARKPSHQAFLEFIFDFSITVSDVVKSGCEVVRSQLENNPLQLAISQPLPECNEFGEYEARQCKNGTLYVHWKSFKTYFTKFL